jgi:hypothetical protein
MIMKAEKSYVVEAGGTRYEVHEGDLLSDSHPVVQAYPKRFSKATTDDVNEANEKARAG